MLGLFSSVAVSAKCITELIRFTHRTQTLPKTYLELLLRQKVAPNNGFIESLVFDIELNGTVHIDPCCQTILSECEIDLVSLLLSVISLDCLYYNKYSLLLDKIQKSELKLNLM